MSARLSAILSLALLSLSAHAQAPAPLAPSGRVTATNRPVFRWTPAAGALAYTLQLTQDGVPQPAFTVDNTNRWQPGADLSAGLYRWRVKRGPAESAFPWSPRKDFAIVPDNATAYSPAGHRAAFPQVPSFDWDCFDPAVNRFTIRLFRGAESLGTLNVNVEKGKRAGYNQDWTNALGKGAYSWQVRASRILAGYTVHGDWSEPLLFQYGVPGITAVTNPPDGTVFGPGITQVPVNWAPAAGAAFYTFKILRNDQVLNIISNFPGTGGALSGDFNPSYHTLFVRGGNSNGLGPWSQPATFTIRRNMFPDGVTTNKPPATFRWTRSDPATAYRFRLLQYNFQTGAYDQLYEFGVPQPATGNPTLKTTFPVPDGKYRWIITDFNGQKAGYTQTARFRVKK